MFRFRMKRARYEDLTSRDERRRVELNIPSLVTIALGAIVNDSTIAAFYSKGRWQ